MLTIKILSIHLKKKSSVNTLFTIPFVKKETNKQQNKKTKNIKDLVLIKKKKKKKRSHECEWGSGSDPCDGSATLLPYFDGNQLC